MKRVLIVQPSLNPPGGGNAVAAWLIQALRDTCRLEVLTWEPIDYDRINRHCGTSLHAGDVVLHTIPAMLARLTPQDGLQLWKHHLLSRFARRFGAECDAIIGINGEADLGPRGIQYIHFPRYADPRLRGERLPRDPAALRWYHRTPWLMQAYFRACALGTGYSHARMRTNLTLVNSDWTGGHYREIHGGNPRTVYPPVSDAFPDVPWAQRQAGFVSIGRIAPEKRFELAIDVLAAVRQRGHDVHLRIVGMVDHNPAYLEKIRRLMMHHKEWITLELDASRAKLIELLATNRFGIHGMRDEHFGIAVGEMVNAGCIVFVPDGGGQVEIVGDYPALIYRDRDDAVEKIDAILRSPERQADARAHLARRKESFSIAAFTRAIRDVVEHYDDLR